MTRRRDPAGGSASRTIERRSDPRITIREFIGAELQDAGARGREPGSPRRGDSAVLIDGSPTPTFAASAPISPVHVFLHADQWGACTPPVLCGNTGVHPISRSMPMKFRWVSHLLDRPPTPHIFRPPWSFDRRASSN